ncbi:hypothetical protein DYB25_005814 [Aphanomyces astaci]|uniref:Mitochondrial resolvase Ydc2 catalytic domain-containing protein n=1 Tax=Aphanomyces astaci TaxID=112090 RepID=A0A397DZX4_APHAT|nr:hypothetical protein DYB25_005814 [Aphanomyces astaci]RHY45630.1 hypothetical protein DYB34_001724 [Aphanomyces astaci]RHY69363.1 hypothetical protein DYB38_002471 [Aphanomyces astaci]RHY71317.1 hypothetical protein DYB30_007905 [Aphanomyces astaci]
MKLIQKLLEKHGIEQVVRSVVQARRSPPEPIRVLGLDINTNSTGFVVLNELGGIESSGHICTKHLQSDGQILDIGVEIAARMSQVHNHELSTTPLVAWEVGIEDFLRTFSPGQFKTKGLFQLAQLNGLVSYCALTTFGVAPIHVHPTAARHFFALKVPPGVPKKKDEIKRVVLAHAIASEPALHLPHMTIPAQFDVADAYVVASYTYWRRVVDTVIATSHPLQSALWPDMEKQLARQIASRSAKTKSFSKQAYLQLVFRQEVDIWVRDHRTTCW